MAVRTSLKRIFAITAEKSINFQIDYQCPQCGAPAVLEETDRLFRCAYCRVSSYLVPPDIFRYTLPIHKSADKDIIYVPYWRFKGMLFSCIPFEIHNRFMDLSHLSVKSDFFPMSLGLRSQALKLKFVTPEAKGQFLLPTLPSEDAMTMFKAKSNRELPHSIFHQEYIGETLSIIYAPVYMKDQLYDGVINQPITIAHPKKEDLSELPSHKLNWNLNFLATLCPDCGWNLEGEKDATTLMCKNCETMWMPLKKGFKKLPFACLHDKDEQKAYLPFWRIQADVSGLPLSTVGDMMRAANVPRIIQEQYDKQQFVFWVMAFKVRPNTFLRTATAITMAQPHAPFEKKLPKNNIIFPANLSITEALESLKLIIANFIRPRETFFPLLEDVTIKPDRFSLAFLPFDHNQHEYINTDYQIAITKTHMVGAFN